MATSSYPRCSGRRIFRGTPFLSHIEHSALKLSKLHNDLFSHTHITSVIATALAGSFEDQRTAALQLCSLCTASDHNKLLVVQHQVLSFSSIIPPSGMCSHFCVAPGALPFSSLVTHSYRPDPCRFSNPPRSHQGLPVLLKLAASRDVRTQEFASEAIAELALQPEGQVLQPSLAAALQNPCLSRYNIALTTSRTLVQVPHALK